MNKFLIRLSIQDQILLAKRLGILIKAGVPILEALRMIEKQSHTKAAKHILQSVIHDVENGQFVSTGLNKFKQVFGVFTINIIHVGEVSGTLEENLNYLAEELQKKQALRRKLISSLIYPALIVVATFGITGLLTIFVFPKILPIFNSFNFKLPWTTRVLIFVSTAVLHYWVFIILGLIIVIAGSLLLLRIKRLRYFFHRSILVVPVLGNLLQSYYMANFCRTLGLLLKSDVRIVKATSITANTISNLVYQRQFENIAEKITQGEKISTYMEGNNRLFPPILSQMITVGEATGNLSQSLLFLAELYENEVDQQTKNLSTVLEPALMIFMGILVGFVAISIITPIYGITQNLKP